MESVIFNLNNDNLFDKLTELFEPNQNITIGEIKTNTFSDGEVSAYLKTSVRGKRVFLLSTPNNSDKIIQLGLSIDSAKRAGAVEIIPIIPYFPYSRSDKKDQTRGPIGAKFIADIIEAAGSTSVITIDLHADQIQGFFNIPVIHLEGKYIFDDYIKTLVNKLKSVVLCAPDAGAAKRVKQFRDRISDITDIKLPIVMIDKTRKVANQIDEMVLIGDVENSNVIIIDDMCDTAGTLCKAAEHIKQKGAHSVFSIVTHGVLSGPAYERIRDSVIKEFICSDTLNIKSNDIIIKSCDKQIYKAIKAINQSISVDKLKKIYLYD
jgi:ribose-phosphate pyrophosphokinase